MNFTVISTLAYDDSTPPAVQAGNLRVLVLVLVFSELRGSCWSYFVLAVQINTLYFVLDVQRD